MAVGFEWGEKKKKKEGKFKEKKINQVANTNVVTLKEEEEEKKKFTTQSVHILKIHKPRLPSRLNVTRHPLLFRLTTSSRTSKPFYPPGLNATIHHVDGQQIKIGMPPGDERNLWIMCQYGPAVYINFECVYNNKQKSYRKSKKQKQEL
ncbi:hypothetical protein OUZ56_014675 [Daphnia magna]|uniref:Uncharacterized protein n=1 Tax=Daphnia magna TaxID=35525 RepID=A0ABR0AKG9_9CRUS|nr:hypothetical protein OUZ56_014675 [Daphnia magna]